MDGIHGSGLAGIPYIEVGYADGSSYRITGWFDQHTLADVARAIQFDSAEEIPDEDE